MNDSLHQNYILIDGVHGENAKSIVWWLEEKGWYLPKNIIKSIPEYPYVGSYFSFRISPKLNERLQKEFFKDDHLVGTFRFNILHKKWYDVNDPFGASSLGDGFRSRLDLAFGVSFLTSYKKSIDNTANLNDPQLRKNLKEILEE